MEGGKKERKERQKNKEMLLVDPRFAEYDLSAWKNFYRGGMMHFKEELFDNALFVFLDRMGIKQHYGIPLLVWSATCVRDAIINSTFKKVINEIENNILDAESFGIVFPVQFENRFHVVLIIAETVDQSITSFHFFATDGFRWNSILGEKIVTFMKSYFPLSCDTSKIAFISPVCLPDFSGYDDNENVSLHRGKMLSVLYMSNLICNICQGNYHLRNVNCSRRDKIDNLLDTYSDYEFVSTISSKDALLLHHIVLHLSDETTPSFSSSSSSISPSKSSSSSVLSAHPHFEILSTVRRRNNVSKYTRNESYDERLANLSNTVSNLSCQELYFGNVKHLQLRYPDDHTAYMTSRSTNFVSECTTSIPGLTIILQTDYSNTYLLNGLQWKCSSTRNDLIHLFVGHHHLCGSYCQESKSLKEGGNADTGTAMNEVSSQHHGNESEIGKVYRVSNVQNDAAATTPATTTATATTGPSHVLVSGLVSADASKKECSHFPIPEKSRTGNTYVTRAVPTGYRAIHRLQHNFIHRSRKRDQLQDEEMNKVLKSVFMKNNKNRSKEHQYGDRIHIAPLNIYEMNHWVLLYINRITKTCYLIDPLHADESFDFYTLDFTISEIDAKIQGETEAQFSKREMSEEESSTVLTARILSHILPNDWVVRPVFLGLQEDGFSCGIWCALFTDFLLLNDGIIGAAWKKMTFYRNLSSQDRKSKLEDLRNQYFYISEHFQEMETRLKS